MTKYITKTAMMVAILATLCACQKDNGGDDDEPDVPPGTTALVSRIELDGSNDEYDYTVTTDFEYNAAEQMTKMRWKSHYDDGFVGTYQNIYTRNGDDLTITQSYEDEDDIDIDDDIFHGKLDKAGRMTLLTSDFGMNITEHLSYSDDGYLMSYNTVFESPQIASRSYVVQWSNGSAIGCRSTDNYWKYSVVSSGIENKMNIDIAELANETSVYHTEADYLLFFRSAGLVGNMDRYLPSSITESNNNGGVHGMSFKYTLNKQGLPTSIIVTYKDDYPEIVKITYK